MKTHKLTPSAVMWGIAMPITLLCDFTRVYWPLAVKSRHRGIYQAPRWFSMGWQVIRGYLAAEVGGWKTLIPRWSDMLILPFLALVYVLCWFLCVLCWGMLL